jgi:hypothetical protein
MTAYQAEFNFDISFLPLSFFVYLVYFAGITAMPFCFQIESYKKRLVFFFLPGFFLSQ